MKVQSAISKIKKRLGIDVSRDVAAMAEADATGGRCNRKIAIPWKGRVLSFYVDGAGTSNPRVSLVHVRREDDHSDMMTDYHAGGFYDNLTQALDAIEPPAPKFAPGALLRVKGTKRAHRWGIADRMGVVIEAGPHGVKLLWNNGLTSDWVRNNDLQEIARAQR